MLRHARAPIPGRWGEAQSIPGGSFPNPLAPMPTVGRTLLRYVNVVGIELCESGAGGLFDQHQGHLERPAAGRRRRQLQHVRSVSASQRYRMTTRRDEHPDDLRRRGWRRRLLRRGRGAAVPGRADAAVGDTGGHQRDGHGDYVEFRVDAAWSTAGADAIRAGRVQQLLPAAGVAGGHQHAATRSTKRDDWRDHER